MTFSHEKLDVYQLALQYVAFAHSVCASLNGARRHARDQLLRSSQSIPLNIAEGNGKVSVADRRRYFEIARGSALEAAATQDVLSVTGALTEDQNRQGKQMLDRIVAMLTKLGGRGYTVREEPFRYGGSMIDFDPDADSERHVAEWGIVCETP